jgi:dinuclear metal center YbgI/SA1388 family protein
VKSGELLKLLEQEVAPLSLSQEMCKACNGYDNSGIIIDSGKQITGIVFSLDLSEKVVERAINTKANCIVTHHPAIYGGIQRLYYDNPQTAALCMCIKNDISVISMHLNFDAAPQGIDYHLMKGIGGDKCKAQINLDGGAYGRVYDIPSTTLKDLVNKIKEQFTTQRVIYYGDDDKIIQTASSFCGAGTDEDAILFAVKNSADVLISSDMKHHHIAELVARKMGVIILTHYASETYGFKKIYKKLINKLNVCSSYFVDDELI